MRLSIDSSALAKRYIQESGSEFLEEILADVSELAFSVILLPEIISGLNRRLREKSIIVAEYKLIKRQLLDDVRDATIIQISPSVVSQSIRLLEANNLRAMDALHLACAIEWKADIFASSDKRQLVAAKNAGLKSVFVA